jgi:hypothetical protein
MGFRPLIFPSSSAVAITFTTCLVQVASGVFWVVEIYVYDLSNSLTEAGRLVSRVDLSTFESNLKLSSLEDFCPSLTPSLSLSEATRQ